MFSITNGDCIEVMKSMDDNSVDSIVTDPPYGLSFMGKEWDHGVPGEDFWIEALRVAKPGAFLLAFGGTRTYHRLACAIEDAGWEIRDSIGWLYGSGFPKSHNISKAIDKLEGIEHPKNTLINKNNSMTGGNYTRNKMDVKSDLANKYSGFGTALKPAWEPIIVARKPIGEKTVADNVIKYGTGGINIDGCRVGNELLCEQKAGTAQIGTFNRKNMVTQERTGRFPANIIHDGSDEVLEVFPNSGGGKAKSNADVKRSGISVDGSSFNSNNCGFDVNKGQGLSNYGDSGSAARFFYCAKASKKDRNEGLDNFDDLISGSFHGDKKMSLGGASLTGNNKQVQPKKNVHPTVKPTDLMRYLCRLVTPVGGTVFDPFMGSGSTGKAAVLEGFNFVGCDLDVNYCEIAVARIKFAEGIDE